MEKYSFTQIQNIYLLSRFFLEQKLIFEDGKKAHKLCMPWCTCLDKLHSQEKKEKEKKTNKTKQLHKLKLPGIQWEMAEKRWAFKTGRNSSQVDNMLQQENLAILI